MGAEAVAKLSSVVDTTAPLSTSGMSLRGETREQDPASLEEDGMKTDEGERHRMQKHT